MQKKLTNNPIPEREDKKDIFFQYIGLTGSVIAALVFLVPIGAWLLTGQKIYLEPIHFLLAGTVGTLQFFITWYYRKKFQRYWETVKDSISQLARKLGNLRRVQDIQKLREEKKQLLLPLLEEKSFSTLGENLACLIDEVLDIMEIKLIKEDLIRKLTSTLDIDRLSNILLNNLLSRFNIPAAAIYLKGANDDGFYLKNNKGFGEIKQVLDENFLATLEARDDVLIEEPLKLPLDIGICELPADKVYIHKLVPRKGKTIGIIFFGIGEDSKTPIHKLREFLADTKTLLALIFENAIEHEKSLSLANIDPLTGAFNRREGFKRLEKLLKQAQQSGGNICLLLLDIDHFKRINDTFGHEAGDRVLKEVVGIVKQYLGTEDLIIRWGGEEFLIVLSDVRPEEALQIAERIRREISQKEIPIKGKKRLKVTVSIGIACTSKEKTYAFNKLFSVADKRLYAAKNKGRNRVVAD